MTSARNEVPVAIMSNLKEFVYAFTDIWDTSTFNVLSGAQDLSDKIDALWQREEEVGVDLQTMLGDSGNFMASPMRTEPGNRLPIENLDFIVSESVFSDLSVGVDHVNEMSTEAVIVTLVSCGGELSKRLWRVLSLLAVNIINAENVGYLPYDYFDIANDASNVASSASVEDLLLLNVRPVSRANLPDMDIFAGDDYY